MKTGLSIFLLAAIVLSTDAYAQATGSRLGRNATAKDANTVAEGMIQCIGGRKPAYAVELMRIIPGSDAERDKLNNNLGDLSICMDDDRNVVIGDNVELKFSPRMFRTSLGRILARAEIDRIDTSKLKEAPAWSLATYDANPKGDNAGDNTLLALFEFGDCVVEEQPEQAANVIRYGAKTDAAKKAIKALVPFLGPCLPQGAELKITPELLGVALAEPIYHRAKALEKLTDKGRP